jgi:hypothetical protein
LLGGTQAEVDFEKQPVGLDVDGKAIEVIKPADIDAARRKPLRQPSYPRMRVSSTPRRRE